VSIFRRALAALVLPLAATLAACGGGGGGGGGVPNLAPVASFTATPASGPVPLVVTLDASASRDPDGSIANHAWDFGDNGTGIGAVVTRTYTVAGSYTVRLTVTDNLGLSASTTRTVTVGGPPPADVAVSGRVTYERVPFSAASERGLNYPGTFEAPAREVEVQLLRPSNSEVLASGVTDTAGNYRLTAPANTEVRVRARAVSRSAGTPARPGAWDLRVVNNTNANALYVLDGASFNTGTADSVRNLRAATGWGGDFAGIYSGPRSAAPFAVLDTLYAAAQFVIGQGDPALRLGPLVAYWSPSNRPSSAWNPSAGDIETTQYRGPQPGLDPGIYVLGAASNDTDEFDAHVIAHEFHHFLEDEVSRADSPGGPHSLSERLDPRLAFSEGFANAFAAMVLDHPLYRDSFGTAQGRDFAFDVERQESTVPGWYNEASVQRIAWDVFDPANEPGDALAVGFGPIFEVLRTELRDEVPPGTLFAFVTALRQRPGVPGAALDARVAAEGIAGTPLGIDAVGMDAWGSTETHSGVAPVSSDLVLPVHAPAVLNGPPVRLCASTDLVTPAGPIESGSYNKLGNRRFVRFRLPASQAFRVRVSCTAGDVDCAGLPRPDPDFVLLRGREATVVDEGTTTVEEREFSNGVAGDYVLEIYEYSHVASDASTRRGRTCMTVTVTG
jgi:PKD repeat protein